MNAGIALLAYARAELDQGIEYLGWRASRRHQGVHLARKSLRRVRATLALAGDAFGRAGEWVDEELRRINRSLSDLRDGQALVESLVRLASHDKAGEHVALITRARRAAEQRRAAVGRSPRYSGEAAEEPRHVLTVVLPAFSGLPWALLNTSAVVQALEVSIENASAGADQAVKRDREKDWHRWRRRERRLSQQCRAMRAVLLDHGHEEHKALAEQLGEAQDFSLLIDHCGSDSPFTREDRHALRALAQARLKHLRARLSAERAPPPAAN